MRPCEFRIFRMTIRAFNNHTSFVISLYSLFSNISNLPLCYIWFIHRHKGSDTSVYALLYKLITHLALRQSRHKPPHCKITNAITVIPPTTPYKPNSLLTNAANAHLLMNTPHTNAHSNCPYMAMMFRKRSINHCFVCRNRLDGAADRVVAS